MASEWVETTIGELLARDGGSVKTGPFGTTLKANEYSTEGVPLISVGEVGYGSLRVHENTPRAPREVVERLPEYVLEPGDIVFGRKGAVDRSAFVKPEQAGWFLGSDGIRLRLPKTSDAHFIAYQLQSVDTRSWLIQHATGTTMASLNQAIIERVPIVLPPLPEQRAIAHILGTLDDKIELNRRMSETLEAMARALFKSWFVDFDPVRAKMQGRDPGLPKPFADLFPARLVDSELGEIPEGCAVKTIGDLAEVVGGSTPATKEAAYWEDGIHYWATPKDLSALSVPVLLETERRITDAGLNQISSGLLSAGTVLLSSRAPIGYLAIAEVPVAINQGFIAMKPRKGVSNLFLLLWAQYAHEEILSHANGSTFLEISKSNFRPISVVAPLEDIFIAFDRIVRPIYQRIVSNERESRTLAALRDALLPKLVSGEMRVPAVLTTCI
jgi:type I restriction enzyme S subunit